MEPQPSQKPVIDVFSTYLTLIRNAVGSSLFRNLYVATDRGPTDILKNGELSCAVFVSSILTLVKKIDEPHATVAGTVKALKNHGWSAVAPTDPQPGDVIVWEPLTFSDGSVHPHIGFSLGGTRAISTSATQKTPLEHDATFDGTRKIAELWRTGWGKTGRV